MNRKVLVLLRELVPSLTVGRAVPESMSDYGESINSEIVLSLINYQRLEEI